MWNARERLQLLMVAVALTAAQQQQVASAADPAYAEPGTPAASLPAEPDFAPAETSIAAEGFAGYYQSPLPFWYFEAQALALKRDASGNTDFAARITEVTTPEGTEATTTMVLGTRDLHFDFRAGGRALVGRTLGDWFGLEVAYFGLGDWNQIAAVRDVTPIDVEIEGVTQTVNGSLFSPFTDFGNPRTVGLDYNNFAYISYFSTLDSLEWNLRGRLPMPSDRLQGSLLVGGRYMNVRERFHYRTESEIPAALGTTNTVSTWTGNEMLGVQIGAQFEFQVEPDWWVDCEIKGVIFDNRADQSTTYVNINNGVEQTYSRGRADNRSTFALDLRLMFTCQISPRLSTRVGYEALWVDGLALASENFNSDVNILMLGPATLSSGGKVVYHGPHIGVTWMW